MISETDSCDFAAGYQHTACTVMVAAAFLPANTLSRKKLQRPSSQAKETQPDLVMIGFLAIVSLVAQPIFSHMMAEACLDLDQGHLSS